MEELLASNLRKTLAELALNKASYSTIMPWVDLTLLNEQATVEELQSLAQQAQQHHAAAICVFPKDLMHIPQVNDIKRATVVNFPTGEFALFQVLENIEQAITDYHAEEIDYVFPYQSYLAGQTTAALKHCNTAYHHCKQQNITFKVILETGAFPTLDLIYQLSRTLIDLSCDFLKTSTGKIATGASLPAAFAILSAIYDAKTSTGIKLSGGIKTNQQANDFICLAEYMLGKKVNKDWFRLGSSTVL